MQVINHTFARKILDADGRYLDTQELNTLEQYLHSYAIRLEVYQQLRDQSTPLIEQALKRLGQAYPDLVNKQGQRCQYDMAEVLRYAALSILRDDETFFKEQMVSWLDTILMAHKKHAHCAHAYRYLLDAINTALPASSSHLVRSYLESVILSLQSHA